MRRRDFLKSAMLGSALYGAGVIPVIGNVAHASGFPVLGRRVLVNITLEGGPDFRYLLPPAWDPAPGSVGNGYWSHMAGAHGVDDTASSLEKRWQEDYFHTSAGETEFGILGACGWLRRMWDEGNVALVFNAYGSTSRNHPHSVKVLNRGDLGALPNDNPAPGWGGRLAAVSGGNVLSLTSLPSEFCFGPNPADPTGYDDSNLLSAPNTRRLTLFRPDESESLNSDKSAISRSLEAYYAAKARELDPDSPFRRFIDLETKLRTFGEPVEERLLDVPVPESIAALFEGTTSLFDTAFSQQIRNLYDSFACSDILDLGVASLTYRGFDTHKAQREEFEPRLNDLFGDGKALDSLYSELPRDVLENTVLVLGGEFGRQIRANGDAGTDHGEGNALLVIGEGVRGGVYGDMFPESELALLGDPSPQIAGRTAIDQVFGEVAEWVWPGSGATVFPDRAGSPVEDGVDIASLFA